MGSHARPGGTGAKEDARDTGYVPRHAKPASAETEADAADAATVPDLIAVR